MLASAKKLGGKPLKIEELARTCDSRGIRDGRRNLGVNIGSLRSKREVYFE